MYTKMIFPNLAVKDLKKTIDFFSKLDFHSMKNLQMKRQHVLS